MTVALAVEARRVEPQITCQCGEPLARVSQYGVPKGVYPLDGVSMDWERPFVHLCCKGCGRWTKVRVMRIAA